jgi:hypothetical protein
MGLLMTWEEIQKKYPDQWVSMINLTRDQNGMVKGGVVVAAEPDLKIVTQKLKKENLVSDAFKYTGQVKNFLGFAKWDITDV